jgi:hypothetical protein
LYVFSADIGFHEGCCKETVKEAVMPGVCSSDIR